MSNNLEYKNAPIVIFAYDRLDHLRLTIEALKANSLAQDSILFVFSDAAKHPDNNDKVLEVRDYIKTIVGFKETFIIERETNFGLAKSIINGVTEVLTKFENVIVLEDDMISSPYFLEYMNTNLKSYEKDEEVISIHGYMYPVSSKLPDFFFLKGADCWGWGTWRRGWNQFEADGIKLLQELESKNLTYEFDFFGSYPYTQMLKDQITGRNNSWAIRWYASAFLNHKLTLYPGHSYIENIGNDGSGTHCSVTDDYETDVIKTREIFYKVPIKEDLKSKKKIKEYFNLVRGVNQKQQRSIKRLLYPKIKALLPLYFKQKLKSYIISRAQSYLNLGNENDPNQNFGFKGDYSDWKSAKNECSGYDSKLILEKCKNALIQVRDGKAVAERDSVLLDEKVYSWPVLTTFFKAAIELGDLHILDFGGSLGSSYYQNFEMLGSILKSWSIVEQKNFVECGKENFENSVLKFYQTIDEVIEVRPPNVILLSSVLPYIEDPFAFIENLISKKIPYILIDRTYFLENGKHRITKQIVPPWIYDASYPAWFFDKTKFIELFLPEYNLIADFDSYLNAAQYLNADTKASERGMILKLKS